MWDIESVRRLPEKPLRCFSVWSSHVEKLRELAQRVSANPCDQLAALVTRHSRGRWIMTLVTNTIIDFFIFTGIPRRKAGAQSYGPEVPPCSPTKLQAAGLPMGLTDPSLSIPSVRRTLHPTCSDSHSESHEPNRPDPPDFSLCQANDFSLCQANYHEEQHLCEALL